MQVLLETNKAVKMILPEITFFMFFYHIRKDRDRKHTFLCFISLFIKHLGVKDKNHDKIEGNTY